MGPLIDFGIARARDGLAGDGLLTRTGLLIGSPGFLSSEQVRGLELTPYATCSAGERFSSTPPPDASSSVSARPA